MHAANFFDTNILLYLFSADINKAKKAEKLLLKGGFISVQVLNEFVRVARQKLKLDWEAIEEAKTAILANVSVLPITIDTHEKATEIAQRYQYGIFDALIIASALEAKAKLLYTEDMQHGHTIQNLILRNPFLGS